MDLIDKIDYKAGFQTDIKQDVFAPGLDESVIRKISSKKNEPDWLLQWRLEAFEKWQKMSEPHWLEGDYDPIDYQAISYYAGLIDTPQNQSWDEVDPKIKETFTRLGIPLEEQKRLSGVAVDVVLDSVSVSNTFKKDLEKLGIIFCSISEAAINYPQLVRKYLGSVVGKGDNFFACLNAAVFSDGTFVFIPKNTKCPVDLSTYFRINSGQIGQFERTLIIAESGSTVSYLEGCTAPIRDNNQLHGAVVELIAMEGASIDYSTVQNWYPGDKNGKGGIYNFVTKRGECRGSHSHISWTQVEVGSAITWKYPSVRLKGEGSTGEFYSIALTNNCQQADTGTKMIHLAPNTKSKILSKSISNGFSKSTYRGQVSFSKAATGSSNYSRCDSLILSDNCIVNTFPEIVDNSIETNLEHEASTGSLSREIQSYGESRGLSENDLTQLLVMGFTKDIMQRLPMEFSVEARQLLKLSLEDGVWNG